MTGSWQIWTPGEAVAHYFVKQALRFNTRFGVKGAGRKVEEQLLPDGQKERVMAEWDVEQFDSIVEKAIDVVRHEVPEPDWLSQRLAHSEHTINAKLLHTLARLMPANIHALWSRLLGPLPGTELRVASLPLNLERDLAHQVQDDGFLLNAETLVILELKVVTRDRPHQLEAEQFWKYMGLLTRLHKDGHVADHVDVRLVTLGPDRMAVIEPRLRAAFGLSGAEPDGQLHLDEASLAPLVGDNWKTQSLTAKDLAPQVAHVRGYRCSYEGIHRAAGELSGVEPDILACLAAVATTARTRLKRPTGKSKT